MKMIKFCLIAVFALCLGGCATMFTAKTTDLHVQAINSKTHKIIPGARCTVKSSKGGVFPVGSNPGTVTIARGSGTLTVNCTAKGYRQTAMGVGSSFAAWSIANVLFWPGFIVDAVTGAITKYPNHATVLMTRA